MKLCRSPPNNSDGIFSVSFSVQPPFNLRSGIGERSENERRTKGDVTITHRCRNEGTAKHKKGTNNTEVKPNYNFFIT